MKFCAWHDSCAVVACAKFCSEMIPYYGVTSKPNLENCSWNLRLVTLLAKWLPQSKRSIPRRHELVCHMTPLRNNHMTTRTRCQAQPISNHLRNSWDMLYDQKSKISSYAPVFNVSFMCLWTHWHASNTPTPGAISRTNLRIKGSFKHHKFPEVYSYPYVNL